MHSDVDKVTRTQMEAVQNVENIARNQKLDTKIHGVDGKIRACSRCEMTRAHSKTKKE